MNRREAFKSLSALPLMGVDLAKPGDDKTVVALLITIREGVEVSLSERQKLLEDVHKFLAEAGLSRVKVCLMDGVDVTPIGK